ncbi:MAG: hypothetical protein WC408_01800 [Candidatus Micrarchaeia archaeon]|jgi:hypothetical protein
MVFDEVPPKKPDIVGDTKKVVKGTIPLEAWNLKMDESGNFKPLIVKSLEDDKFIRSLHPSLDSSTEDAPRTHILSEEKLDQVAKGILSPIIKHPKVGKPPESGQKVNPILNSLKLRVKRFFRLNILPKEKKK